MKAISMHIAQTISQMRQYVAEARAASRTVGLVPTMGALHVGHVSLIEAAAERSDCVVVSIFVNPTQFGPGEDFGEYPRPIESDLDICRQKGVWAVFAPTPQEMYPSENVTWVSVERLTDPLCGQLRPGHFRGVTTVCAKLFNIVRPDIAVFGQKDAQQAAVIRRMVAELNMPLEIVVRPTVREADGLAVSSRNQYLRPDQRRVAPAIYKSLRDAEAMVLGGTAAASDIRDCMRRVLGEVADMQVEYAEVVDADTLEQLDYIRGKVLLAVAARLGATRLIDNIVVDTPMR